MATTPYSSDTRDHAHVPLPSLARSSVRPRLLVWWLGSLLIAGGLATGLEYVSMRPPVSHLLQLVVSLAEAGALALLLGAVALAVTRTRLAHRMWPKLALPPVLAVLIIGVITAALTQGMFLSWEDSRIILVILVFAGVLALTLASTLASNMGYEIARLEMGARRIAHGEYAHRVANGAGGETAEIERLGHWFNVMAAHVQEAFAQRDTADTERKHLIAALSHDLRTPVTSLRAMLEAIDDGVVSEPATVSRYHHTMRSEVVRLSGLMDELFEMARLDAGAMPLRRERLGLDDLISDALEAFHERAEQRGVQLVGHVADSLPLLLLDPQHISRALANLLQNAVAYTAPGGTVLIRARLSPDNGADTTTRQSVIVAVVDAGPGITAEDLPHIFERTYRGESARSRASESATDSEDIAPVGAGAGLGLAITRAIIELHGGQIWAESPVSPDVWTELTPLLPAGSQTSARRGALVAFSVPV